MGQSGTANCPGPKGPGQFDQPVIGERSRDSRGAGGAGATGRQEPAVVAAVVPRSAGLGAGRLETVGALVGADPGDGVAVAEANGVGGGGADVAAGSRDGGCGGGLRTSEVGQRVVLVVHV